MPKRSITQIVFVLFVLTMSLLLVGCGEDGDAPAATTAATDDNTATTPGTDPEPVPGAKVPSFEYLDSNVVAGQKYQLPPGPGIENSTQLQVLLADKKGNNNFFESGTNVFLMTESGLASTSDVAVADEEGHVVFDLYVDGKPKVATTTPSWVVALRTKMVSDYPQSHWFDSKNPPENASPLNGYVSVVYYVRGEEQYDDDNGNGQYDDGEDFEDTDGDPYVDYNGNGAYDSNAEFFFSGSTGGTFLGEKTNNIDSSDSFTGKNGQWDGDKWIFKHDTFLVGRSLPGEKVPSPRIAIDDTGVDSNGLYTFTVVVCDDNYNEISSGSTIAISVSESDAMIVSGRITHTVESGSVRIAQGDDANKVKSQIDVISYPMKATASGPITVTVNVTWASSSANTDIAVSWVGVGL